MQRHMFYRTRFGQFVFVLYNNFNHFSFIKNSLRQYSYIYQQSLSASPKYQAMVETNLICSKEENVHSFTVHDSISSIVEDSTCDDFTTSTQHNIGGESNQLSKRSLFPSRGAQQRKTRPNESKVRRQLLTQHHYHDHAFDPVSDNKACSPFPSSTFKHKGNHPNANSNCLATPFPLKFYEMIEQTEAQGLSHIVSWQPHGRCFKVHDMSSFKILIQKYFKQHKLASFQRQLNLYGYQRLTTGLDKGSYYHELFLRGRPDLVCQIDRVKVKGTGVRAKSNPSEEPNFYAFPAVDTLAYLASLIANTSPQVKEQLPATEAALSPLKCSSMTMPLLRSSVSDIPGDAGFGTHNGMDLIDIAKSKDCAHLLSVDEPCAIMTGLVRNLSSLNVLTLYGTEPSLNSWRNTNMQNAFFPASSNQQNATLRSPYILRNVSSRLQKNNRSFLSTFTDDDIAADLNNLLDPHQETQSVAEMHGNATIAVDKLRTDDGIDDDCDVSFDKLVEEMFHQDQNDMSNVVKFATESYKG
jgi:HSF-type DNA-binding